VCIFSEQLCDLSNDCGDNSDEATELCQSYFYETFEDEGEKFFHNGPNQPVNWVRGSGDQLLKARAPNFDHTTFSNRGHYMMLEMKNGTTSDLIRSILISSMMEPPENPDDVCRIRFYFHMLREHQIAALRLYIEYVL